MRPLKNFKIMTNSNEIKTTNYSVKYTKNEYRDTEIQLNHFKGFKVVYLSPTSYNGTRIKLTDLRTKKSVTISRGEEDNYRDDAIKYITEVLKIKVSGFVSDETLGFYLILTDDFSKCI